LQTLYEPLGKRQFSVSAKAKAVIEGENVAVLIVPSNVF